MIKCTHSDLYVFKNKLSSKCHCLIAGVIFKSSQNSVTETCAFQCTRVLPECHRLRCSGNGTCWCGFIRAAASGSVRAPVKRRRWKEEMALQQDLGGPGGTGRRDGPGESLGVCDWGSILPCDQPLDSGCSEKVKQPWHTPICRKSIWEKGQSAFRWQSSQKTAEESSPDKESMVYHTAATALTSSDIL